MDLTSITPGPEALHALSHPARMRILGLLRQHGPATATGLAQRLGLNSGATSYHLRHLARHGFIVDDPERGNARERWWRAAHQSTRTDAPTTPEERRAQEAFGQAIAVVHTEVLQRAVEEAELRPEAWVAASTLSDWGMRVTPQRARALMERLVAVLEEFEEDDEDEPEAGAYTVMLHAFPRPGTLEGPEPTP